MRLVALFALASCSSATTTTTPKTTVPAPTPVVPMCTGVECEAKLEPAARFEPPNPDEFRPPDAVGTPPETATCATVGEVVASTEVGNYAEPEVREPAVAKYTALCEAQKLDQEARTCVAQQGDKPSIAYCAPAMAPDVPMELFPTSECDAAIKAATARLATRPASDWEKKWWTPRAQTFLASCKKDRWTKLVGECVRAGSPQSCSYQAVRPLQVKLEAMLVAANVKEQQERDLFAKAYAEPKKYPRVKVPLVDARGCTAIMKAAKARIDKQGPTSWEAQWWTPRAKAYAQSCAKDRWTLEVGDCVKTQFPGNCYQFAPAPLQQKLIQLYQQALPAPPPPKQPRAPKAPKTPKRKR